MFYDLLLVQSPKKLIEDATLVIFDSDGILVQEGIPLPGSRELVRELTQHGKQVVVLSNNSTAHPKDMLSHYHNQGIMVDYVVNSGILAVEYCHKNDITSVYIVGESGLVNLLAENQISVKREEVDAVIVGMDRTLTYEKLAIATRLIRGGAKFIGTNPDKSFPTERGLEPGAGSMIAALEASTSQSPEIVLGKPQIFGFEYILEKTGSSVSQSVMVGDRYETDIIGAIAANIPAFVVNTGVAATRSAPGKYQNYPEVPVIDSLLHLLS